MVARNLQLISFDEQLDSLHFCITAFGVALPLSLITSVSLVSLLSFFLSYINKDFASH